MAKQYSSLTAQEIVSKYIPGDLGILDYDSDVIVEETVESFWERVYKESSTLEKDIVVYGYNSNSYIELTKDGRIINGHHRLSIMATLYPECKLPVIVYG